MSSGCMRWLLNHSVALWAVRPGSCIPASNFLKCNKRSDIICACTWRWSPYCTTAKATEQTPASKKKQQVARGHGPIISVGRKIPHQHVQLLSETGESMGTMHRANVLRVLDESGLKLVLLNQREDPPIYQLMSGKQLHQEQLKQQEKQKAKPVQVKEVNVTSDISSHDVSIKLKQVEGWLEKKHHVRITLRSGRNKSPENLDKTLEKIVQQIEIIVGFVSMPTLIKDGKAAMCIIRPPSAKEIAKQGKKSTTGSQSADSDLEKTKTVSAIDTPEEKTTQQ